MKPSLRIVAAVAAVLTCFAVLGAGVRRLVNTDGNTGAFVFYEVQRSDALLTFQRRQFDPAL